MLSNCNIIKRDKGDDVIPSVSITSSFQSKSNDGVVELDGNIATLSWNLVGIDDSNSQLVISASIKGEIRSSSDVNAKLLYDVYFGVATTQNILLANR